MKPVRIILLLFSIAISQTPWLRAQDLLNNKVYRVMAFKQGNTTVTSTSNYAEVAPPLNIYIPSAFTPNGDGINETFGIKGEGIKDYHILIYNRWGEIIFESTDARKQWDGKIDGNPVEQGTYVYKFFANGTKKGKTGAVTVIY